MVRTTSDLKWDSFISMGANE